MINPDTKMCTSDNLELKRSPLKPYQDNVFSRPVYTGLKMQSLRPKSDDSHTHGTK